MGEGYGPAALVWEYNPEPPERFFSWYISGAQRLPNGNTLVNQGAGAKLREVTASGDIVWEYVYGRDFRFACPRWSLYTPEGSRALETLVRHSIVPLQRPSAQLGRPRA